MIKMKMVNSTTGSSYDNIEFNSEKLVGDKILPNLNLIYASNAVGKSTFADIIECHFNNKDQIINKFNKNKSLLEILDNPGNITEVYKYDRNFANESVGVYNDKLIVSPKNAKNIIKLREDIDKESQLLLDAYKISETYAILKGIQKQIDSKSELIKFCRQTYRTTHASELEILLTDYSEDDDLVCYDLDILELIDFYQIKSNFLTFCQEANKDIFEIIKDNFPAIDSAESKFYESILDYLLNHEEKVLNKLCSMCGKTKMTDELIKDRISTLKQKIEDYNSSISSTEYFSIINDFIIEDFVSKKFKIYQDYVKDKDKNDLILGITLIGKDIKDINLKHLKENGIKCILELIRNDKAINSRVLEIEDLKSKLDELTKNDVYTINEEVKEKFIENLARFQFEYFNEIEISLKDDNIIEISAKGVGLKDFFNEILSESEKSILSFSLFKSIISDYSNSIILIDDPIDSHDQKNKWFILNNVVELAEETKSIIVILTHDLSVSKSLSRVSTDIAFTNSILTKTSLNKVDGPCLYFSDLHDFVFNVIQKVNRYDDNEKYFLPLAFLIRYLAKDQNKLFNEVNKWQTIPLDIETITRETTKKIGFIDISNKFVHYCDEVNSEELLNCVEKIMKIERKSSLKPTYFTNKIESDILIQNIINDIGERHQFDRDIKKIISAILIRNVLEKKLKSKLTMTNKIKLSDYVKQYHTDFGDDKLYKFYKKNKPMVDEFAHLESGISALLTYDIHYVNKQLEELKRL